MKIVREGIYFLFDKDELVYIGESDNIFRRIGEHVRDGTKEFDRFEVYPTWDRKSLEGFLISTLKPKYNVSGGANYDFFVDDMFPSQSLDATIRKYKESHKDVKIGKIADALDMKRAELIRVLSDHDAPIYKIDHAWRVDREWFNEHRDDVTKWYYE